MNPATLILALLCAVPLRAWDQNLRSPTVPAAPSGPADPAWENAPPAQVRLGPQSLLMPIGGGAVTSVEVRSLRAGGEIFFRLSWADASKSEDLELSGQFVDACAIQFPLERGGLPSPFMGEKGRAVNIWRWSAAMAKPGHFPKAYADYYRPDSVEKTVKYPQGPEDLLAEGFGTLGRRAQQPVNGVAEWRKGRWSVMLRRPLSVPGGASFAEKGVVPFAVAVWDGAGKERDGSKSFSVWQNLLLDVPAPAVEKNVIERGRRVYARYGCATCHGEGGKGGVPNPGAQTDPIPGLERVAEGFTEDEVKKIIREGRAPAPKDPRGIRPRLWMNAWATLLDEEELDALVDYLFSLMPKGEEEKW